MDRNQKKVTKGNERFKEQKKNGQCLAGISVGRKSAGKGKEKERSGLTGGGEYTGLIVF